MIEDWQIEDSTYASECNAPNISMDYSDDRRRLRRRRLTSDICLPDHANMCIEPDDDSLYSRRLATDFHTCVDCISRCMLGCTKTCQCSTNFIWTHNR